MARTVQVLNSHSVDLVAVREIFGGGWRCTLQEATLAYVIIAWWMRSTVPRPVRP